MKTINFFILLCLMIISSCSGDTLMWQEKGSVLEGVRPGVMGDMLVDSNERVFIFDPFASPSLTFKPRTVPTEQYVPQFTEDWMDDSSERANRSMVRLLRSAINGDPSLLFSEYGQNGYWWISEDMKTIYILVQWVDYKKDEPAHLTFWKSTNGGVEFKKMSWNNHQIGRGRSAGMYFDKAGLNGYIFVELNTLLQTQDGGETWHKVYIPHTESKPLPYLEIAIDTATVDRQGNLLFALAKGADTFIYQIPHDNKTTDLSQIEAKYQLPKKRLLSMTAMPDKEGFYLAYITCSDEQCTWFTYDEEENDHKKNQPLRLAQLVEGKIINDQPLSFFMPVKKVYVNEQGRVAMTLTQANRRYYFLLLSNDYGKTWTLEDLTNTGIVSDYVDLKNNQYWQHRTFRQVYMAKGLFKD